MVNTLGTGNHLFCCGNCFVKTSWKNGIYIFLIILCGGMVKLAKHLWKLAHLWYSQLILLCSFYRSLFCLVISDILYHSMCTGTTKVTWDSKVKRNLIAPMAKMIMINYCKTATFTKAKRMACMAMEFGLKELNWIENCWFKWTNIKLYFTNTGRNGMISGGIGTQGKAGFQEIYSFFFTMKGCICSCFNHLGSGVSDYDNS